MHGNICECCPPWGLKAAAADNEYRSSNSMTHCIVNTHLISLAQREVEWGETELSFISCRCVVSVARWSQPLLIINWLFCSLSCCRMLLTLLSSCTGGAALLYVLYRWLIPAVVQYHGGLVLIWHDVIVERMLDTLTRSTRPQVCLHHSLFTLSSGQPRCTNGQFDLSFLMYRKRRLSDVGLRLTENWA